MGNYAHKLITILLFGILGSAKSHPPQNSNKASAAGPTKQLEPPEGRIVGGYEAHKNQFPYQVSVQLDGMHRCGGAVFTSTIIVSAAHCLELADMPELYAVRAGSLEHERGGAYLPVRSILKHPLYQPPTVKSSDIAVLALANPLPFGINIQPIPLATSADETGASGTVLFISGWGATAEASQAKSARLRYATVQQFDQSYCKTALATATYITKGMMCAGVAGGGRDSCQGDSGGPLAANLHGRSVLLGIVAFGVGCGRPNYPGIYTRIAEYRDWIELTAKQI